MDNKEKVLAIDLTEGDLTSRMIRFAVPFVLANLLQIVYNLVDTVIVGRFVGAAGISGVSMAGQITQMATALTMGLVTGAQIMIAQYRGARETEDLNYTIGTMTVYGGAVALLMAVLGIATSTWGLNLIHTPEEAMGQAKAYEIIVFGGLVFNCGYMTVSAVLRGMGDSKRPFLFVAIASVCNVILDLLFVGVFKMEAAGAAWATIISHFLSFVFAVHYIYKNREGFGVDFKAKYFRIRWDLCKTITKLGIPMALQWIIFSLSMLYIQSMVNVYGLVASAAVAIGSKASQITGTITGAMSNACSTTVGQNIAARRIDRVKKAVAVGILVNVVWMCLCILLLQLFPGPFVRMFNTEPEVVEVGITYLRIVSWGFIGHAFYMIFNGFILGVGNSLLNMTNSLLEGVVLKITFAILFANVLGMGLTGIFIGNALAPVGACIPGAVYYFSGMWKNRKLVAQRDAEAVE